MKIGPSNPLTSLTCIYSPLIQTELLGNTFAAIRGIARNGEMTIQPKIGGCFTGENPALDGRCAQPRWTSSASISLMPAPYKGNASLRFSLWRIPGRKQLFHQGSELQLWTGTTACDSQVRLALGLEDSAPFAYLIPADELANARLLAVREAVENYQSTAKIPDAGISKSRSRAELFHMRALQAFDATAAGASHREIADVLLGADAVAGGWSKDSDIRAQVRYLLKRARHYVNRGYLSLIDASDARGRR